MYIPSWTLCSQNAEILRSVCRVKKKSAGFGVFFCPSDFLLLPKQSHSVVALKSLNPNLKHILKWLQASLILLYLFVLQPQIGVFFFLPTLLFCLSPYFPLLSLHSGVLRPGTSLFPLAVSVSFQMFWLWVSVLQEIKPLPLSLFLSLSPLCVGFLSPSCMNGVFELSLLCVLCLSCPLSRFSIVERRSGRLGYCLFGGNWKLLLGLADH